MPSNIRPELRKKFPNIYDDVLEIDELATGDATVLNVAFDALKELQADQTIPTASEGGLERYERIFDIVATPSESIEFRRTRLLNRFAMSPPFTLRFLKQKLNALLGEGNWSYELDYASRTLKVYTVVTNSAWAQEITITMSRLKPANLVFLSSPLVPDTLHANETISSRQRQYHYKLGTSWILGLNAFASESNPEVIKMATISSIGDALLNGLASSVASQISKVVINGTYTITDFKVKSATNNQAVIEYEVPSSANISAITSVELKNSSDERLTYLEVYVLNVEGVILTHKITVKEGV